MTLTYEQVRLLPDAAEHREIIREGEAFSDLFSDAVMFPRLAYHAGHYVRRMSDLDREVVLAIALELAWQYRGEFDPKVIALVRWWDGWLQCAMRTRNVWMLRYQNGWAPCEADLVPFQE